MKRSMTQKAFILTASIILITSIVPVLAEINLSDFPYNNYSQITASINRSISILQPVSIPKISEINKGNNISKNNDEIRKELYNGSFKINENTKLKGTFLLNFTLNATYAAPNTTIKLFLPDSIELISGDLISIGDIKAGESKYQSIIIKPLKKGILRIRAWVENSEFKGIGKEFITYFNFTAENAYLQKNVSNLSSILQPARRIDSNLSKNESINQSHLGATNTVVYGYLYYIRPDNSHHAIRYATVQLWKSNFPLPDELLQISNTDYQGRFQFDISTSGSINAYVKVLADTEAVEVVDSWNFFICSDKIPFDGYTSISSGTNYFGSWVR